METVMVQASTPYPVYIGGGLLDRGGELISRHTAARRCAVITDDTVCPLYGPRLCRALEAAGLESVLYVVPAGEQQKTLATYGQILGFLAESRITRSDCVVALGGGVVGDMAGFAAATYQRGIDFVQVPTTFLAASDASVGGKTAVDLPAGKNLVGAFWQPKTVICDTDTFSTLPEDTFRRAGAGPAEDSELWPHPGPRHREVQRLPGVPRPCCSHRYGAGHPGGGGPGLRWERHSGGGAGRL